MGKRDYRHRETKKHKKDVRKPLAGGSALPTPMTVEVIRKGKKSKEPEKE